MPASGGRESGPPPPRGPMQRQQSSGVLWGLRMPALSGNQFEARPGVGTGNCFGALLLPGEVSEGGREARGQTPGRPGSAGRGTSAFILPAELSECQGKLQELHRLLQSLESLHRIPSAPVIPTHQVRARGGARALLGGLSCLGPSPSPLPRDRPPDPLRCCGLLESRASA